MANGNLDFLRSWTIEQFEKVMGSKVTPLRRTNPLNGAVTTVFTFTSHEGERKHGPISNNALEKGVVRMISEVKDEKGELF